MTKRLIRSRDGASLHMDADDDGHFVLFREQEIGNLTDRIRHMGEQYGEFSHQKDSGMRHAAEIPEEVFADLEMRGIAQDPARLKAWLNDPDNRIWRVWKGRV